MQRWMRYFLSACLAPCILSAQASPHRVTGRVYDRVSHRFLAGAVVHAFPLDSATSSIFTTI